MAGEWESLKALVARLILEQLDGGLLDKVSHGAAQGPFDQYIHLQGIPSAERVGIPTVIGGGMAAELQPVRATFEGGVDEDGVVEDIRHVSPELADKIESRSPQDKTALLNLWTALINLVAAAVTAWHILNPQPPPPAQIEQICINAINCVMNVPPAH